MRHLRSYKNHSNPCEKLNVFSNSDHCEFCLGLSYVKGGPILEQNKHVISTYLLHGAESFLRS